MKLVRAEIVPFGGTLEARVSNAQGTWRARHGLILRLYAERGAVGQGEASPLPGFSQDDLPAARAALEGFRTRLADFDLEQPLDAIGGAATTSAAARFAIETAVLDLRGQHLARPLWALLGTTFAAVPQRMPVAVLVDMADVDAARRSAESALERGISTFKLKVGRHGAWDAELRIAAALRVALGPAVRLRFDANRAWSPSEAAVRLRELAALDPEFVEEPLGAGELPELGRSPVPLALDESLLRLDRLERRDELRDGGVVAVVLKPMLLGGFSRCLALAARARALGLRVVVSHLFDGPVGLTAAAALALATGRTGDGAAGLDRHRGLSSWPPIDLPAIAPAEVLPWTAPGLGLPLLAGSEA